jgi:hypothetical protein
MKLFSKKEQEPRTGSTISRISRLENGELYGWFNNTLMGLGRSFDSWRYEDGPNEIDSYLETLNELWKEISSRNNGN